MIVNRKYVIAHTNNIALKKPNHKDKAKAIKLIPSNEEGKQEGDSKQEEQEGVSKRQKKQSSTTGDDNHIVYENFVCNTI